MRRPLSHTVHCDGSAAVSWSGGPAEANGRGEAYEQTAERQQESAGKTALPVRSGTNPAGRRCGRNRRCGLWALASVWRLRGGRSRRGWDRNSTRGRWGGGSLADGGGGARRRRSRVLSGDLALRRRLRRWLGRHGVRRRRCAARGSRSRRRGSGRWARRR